MTDMSLPSRRQFRAGESPMRRALRVQVQVIWALMLHDIKSRFFGSGLGYIVTILWPTAHIAILLGIFVIAKRPVPYGQSAMLYASTGVLPYIAWNYMSRFTMMAVVMNKSFLQYPIINYYDIMFARIILESITLFIITTGLVLVNILAQVDIRPISLDPVIFGVLSAVLLGVGFGILNSVITLMFNLWYIGYVGILILFWFTAGLALNPEAMPDRIGYWLSWNPLLHSVEWLRTGFYPDFPAHLLDKNYVLFVGFGSLALGLALCRVCRPLFR